MQSNLAQAMRDANARKRLVRQVPSEKMASGLDHGRPRSLPPVVTY